MSKKPKQLEFNPLCEILPEMPEAEFKELVADIEKNGLKEPIQLDAEGRILDGRHRYRACLAALRAKPEKFTKWRGSGTPERYAEYILQRNILRRNLTAAQRAQVVVRLNDAVLAQRGRPTEQNPNNKSATVADLSPKHHENTGKTSVALAKQAGVGVRTIERARAVHARAPEQEAAVIAGEKSATEVLAKANDKGVDDEPIMSKCPVSGHVLKDRIAEEWSAAIEALTAWKASVAKVRREITAVCEEKAAWATFVHLQSITAHAKNLESAIRFALPHCLCPQCSGDATGCKLCRKRGWIPKEIYDQEVPTDTKWK